MGKFKYYAVANGKTTGVFNSWSECSDATKGHSGASFKGFNSLQEAQAFVATGAASSSGQGIPASFSSPTYISATSGQESYRSLGSGSASEKTRYSATFNHDSSIPSSSWSDIHPPAYTYPADPPPSYASCVDDSSFSYSHPSTTTTTITTKAAFRATKVKEPFVSSYCVRPCTGQDRVTYVSSSSIAAAQDAIARARDGKVIIYTDGASIRNPGYSGASAYAELQLGEDVVVVEVILPCGKNTNNYCELKGIRDGTTMAMEAMAEVLSARGLNMRGREVRVFTDSEWAVRSMAGVYKNTGRYKDLIPAAQSALAQVAEEHDCSVAVQWVKGHAGNQFPGNVRADELAVQAAKMSMARGETEGSQPVVDIKFQRA